MTPHAENDKYFLRPVLVQRAKIKKTKWSHLVKVPTWCLSLDKNQRSKFFTEFIGHKHIVVHHFYL